VEQELITLPELQCLHLVLSGVLVARILITPLVSSNSSYLNNIPKTAILTFVLFLK
jgi:hypothetical protein